MLIVTWPSSGASKHSFSLMIQNKLHVTYFSMNFNMQIKQKFRLKFYHENRKNINIETTQYICLYYVEFNFFGCVYKFISSSCLSGNQRCLKLMLPKCYWNGKHFEKYLKQFVLDEKWVHTIILKFSSRDNHLSKMLLLLRT